MGANRRNGVILLLLGTFLVSPRAQAQMGHMLEASGPINQSMGGAGTALPLDSLGALRWNPASITGLSSSEFSLGVTGLILEEKLNSAVNAGALGPGVPPVGLAGSSSSDVGIIPLPNIGIVYKPEESSWTYGLGVLSVAGFGVNYPGSLTNPITGPQPGQGGLGLGPIYSKYQLLQLSPTVAYQLGERLSIGGGPILNYAMAAISPFAFATPDLVNGLPVYPSGASGDAVWGIGFSAGVFFQDKESGWNLGASVASPQWFQKTLVNSVGPTGVPRQLRYQLDFPILVSAGVAYTGIDRWKFAGDFRFIDYENTRGFQSAGFDPTGAVTGLGWKDVWELAFGVQYRAAECLALRAGYAYSSNAITPANNFINVAAPVILQNTLSCGFSYFGGNGWVLSAAYSLSLPNSVSGAFQTPAGPVPGFTETSFVTAHSITVGIARLF